MIQLSRTASNKCQLSVPFLLSHNCNQTFVLNAEQSIGYSSAQTRFRYWSFFPLGEWIWSLKTSRKRENKMEYKIWQFSTYGHISIILFNGVITNLMNDCNNKKDSKLILPPLFFTEGIKFSWWNSPLIKCKWAAIFFLESSGFLLELLPCTPLLYSVLLMGTNGF